MISVAVSTTLHPLLHSADSDSNDMANSLSLKMYASTSMDDVSASNVLPMEVMVLPFGSCTTMGLCELGRLTVASCGRSLDRIRVSVVPLSALNAPHMPKGTEYTLHVAITDCDVSLGGMGTKEKLVLLCLLVTLLHTVSTILTLMFASPHRQKPRRHAIGPPLMSIGSVAR